MNSFKKVIYISTVLLSFSFFAQTAFAAAPDGLGPWADSVFSFHQGVMKNGLAVPAARSDTSSALGVAENDTTDGHFFSLGFGGDIALGFDNGISNGVVVVEATNPSPPYPLETAKVEMSEDGVHWVMAGNVVQDGSVDQPDAVECAKYVRITDTSIAANYPDDIADGYDVDGVRATGDACTPTSTPSPTPTGTPNDTTSGGGGGGSTTTSTNSPGFPDTGGCSSSGVSTIPSIIDAHRVSPTSIFVSWGPDAGLNNFVVQYGFQNGNWQFSTNVSGFSTTINSLPSGQSVYIHVAATDGCVTGSFGTAVLVGGTVTTTVPGFPNTGFVPGLPDTGVGPDSQKFSWNIRMDLSILISNLLSIFK